MTPCKMTFTQKSTKKAVEVVLKPRSVMVQQGDVRYNWTHGIEPHSSEVMWKLGFLG